MSYSKLKRNKINNRYAIILFSSLAIFLVFCLFTEITLRSINLESTVTDDIRLWAVQRSRVNESQNQVVLLGNSRMLTNFDVREAQKEFLNKEFIQLGILGSSPLPILSDLAQNTSFSGLAIVALWEPDLQLNKSESIDSEKSLTQQYIQFYHQNFSINSLINRELETFLQNHLVLLHPFYNLRNNFSNLVRRRSPSKFYVSTDPSRSRDADYSLINIDLERKRRVDRVKRLHQVSTKLTPDEWLNSANDIKRNVEIIQERGGQVILVYFPISGESRNWMRNIYPRQIYWDNLDKQLGLETIHYEDYPELVFDCPDTSHLDKRDKTKFTLNLLNLIKL